MNNKKGLVGDFTRMVLYHGLMKTIFIYSFMCVYVYVKAYIGQVVAAPMMKVGENA